MQTQLLAAFAGHALMSNHVLCARIQQLCSGQQNPAVVCRHRRVFVGYGASGRRCVLISSKLDGTAGVMISREHDESRQRIINSNTLATLAAARWCLLAVVLFVVRALLGVTVTLLLLVVIIVAVVVV